MDKIIHDLLHQIIEIIPAHPRDLERAHQLVDDALEPAEAPPADDVSRETSQPDAGDAKGKTPAAPAFRAPAGA